MQLRSIKIWISAVRAPFFTASLISVLLGAIIAWHQTDLFDLSYFVLTLTGVLFLNAGTNLANDYFDHQSGTDDINREITPFSAGSRVIQKNLLAPHQVYRAGLLCFSLGSLIGLYLTWTRGPIVLLLGLIGVLSGYFYTAPPLRIGYRKWGELLVGLNFGCLAVLGSYYVQAQHLSLEALTASIPVGLLISAVLYINEFPDYVADKAVGKHTLPVMLGKAKAVKGYHGLIISVYLSLFLGVLLRMMPVAILVALVTIPFAWKAMKIVQLHYDDTKKLIPANAATIALHFFSGLLMCTWYVIDKLLSIYKLL